MDKPVREPVEQLGVRWRGPHQTKVIGRAHQSLAKVLLPDAVHHDAGGERVVIRRQPVRQAQSAPSAALIGRGKGRLLLHQDRRHGWLHLIARP